MSPKSIITIAIVIVALIFAAVIVTSAIGICDTQEYIVVQPIFGEVRIQEGSGVYWRGFART